MGLLQGTKALKQVITNGKSGKHIVKSRLSSEKAGRTCLKDMWNTLINALKLERKLQLIDTIKLDSQQSAWINQKVEENWF